jgi:hypothetical protein
MKPNASLRSILLLTALTLPMALPAAVIPYTNDFSGSGGNTAFPNTTGTWNLSGGSYQASMATGTNLTTTATQQITNADGQSFVMSTQFSLSSAATLPSNQSFTLGFGAFGTSQSFSSAGANSLYLADFTYSGTGTANPSLGTLRILSLNDSTDFTSTAASALDSGATAPLAIKLDTVYTLQLTGVFTDGDLSLTLSLYNAAGTTQIGTSATAADGSPLTGDYFGYRNRNSGNVTTGTSTIAYDNFSLIAVPEPATSLAFGVGAAVLLFRRRVARQSV